MKNYRVKSYGETDFIVQERQLLFSWYTHTERGSGITPTTRTFKTKEEALRYANKRKEIDTKIKRDKFIEYV
jgi:hypothetical protein